MDGKNPFLDSSPKINYLDIDWYRGAYLFLR